jgi:hypothetical protein
MSKELVDRWNRWLVDIEARQHRSTLAQRLEDHFQNCKNNNINFKYSLPKVRADFLAEVGIMSKEHYSEWLAGHEKAILEDTKE